MRIEYKCLISLTNTIIFNGTYKFYKWSSVKLWAGFTVFALNFPACKNARPHDALTEACVWLPDVVDLLDTMFPPELSILRNTNPLTGPGVSAPRLGVPFPFAPPMDQGLPYLSLPPHLEDRPWLGGGAEPEEGQGVLSVGLSVQCEEKRMVVSIDKESLQVSGRLLPADLSLWWNSNISKSVNTSDTSVSVLQWQTL